MENSMWIWIGIGVLFVFFLMMYNGFVRKRNDVDNAFAMIDAQLKKRFDLIPNLVGAVKTYMAHERETLEKITALRTRAMSPNTSGEELMAYGTEAAGLLHKIMVQVENYPDLKASANFLQLQNALDEVEEQLSAARRTFNGAVTEYNNAIQVFPNCIFAPLFGFRKRQVFEAAAEERVNPDVSSLFK